MQRIIAVLCVFLLLAPARAAEPAATRTPVRPRTRSTQPDGRFGWLTRNYRPGHVPPVDLAQFQPAGIAAARRATCISRSRTPSRWRSRTTWISRSSATARRSPKPPDARPRRRFRPRRFHQRADRTRPAPPARQRRPDRHQRQRRHAGEPGHVRGGEHRGHPDRQRHPQPGPGHRRAAPAGPIPPPPRPAPSSPAPTPSSPATTPPASRCRRAFSPAPRLSLGLSNQDLSTNNRSADFNPSSSATLGLNVHAAPAAGLRRGGELAPDPDRQEQPRDLRPDL